MSPRLTAIHRYPVKSCRGASVPDAVVEPWGLAGDRRWLVIDPDGRFRTARECRDLLLVEPRPTSAGGLVLSAPGTDELIVVAPEHGELVSVSVWSSTLDATVVPSAEPWLTTVLGAPSRLVYLDDPTRRLPNQSFAGPDDRVSFADGYPLLVATTASLDDLNDRILQGPGAEEGPLPMTRFRPNLVIAGTEPWAEDGWRRLRIGDATFRAVKGCARCAITMTDPWTTERGREPIRTLAGFRRWDGETWFGMNLIPDTSDVRIAVGDEVTILESVAAPDGPPR